MSSWPMRWFTPYGSIPVPAQGGVMPVAPNIFALVQPTGETSTPAGWSEDVDAVAWFWSPGGTIPVPYGGGTIILASGESGSVELTQGLAHLGQESVSAAAGLSDVFSKPARIN